MQPSLHKRAPLICEVNTGLANRLRAAVSALCGAELLDRPLYLIWAVEPGHHVAPFEALFDVQRLPPFVHIMSAPPPGFQPASCLSPIDWIVTQSRALAAPAQAIHIKSHGHFFQSDRAKWESALRCFFRPAPALAARLDALGNLEAAIGIHVRRGDNAQSIRWSPTQLFYKAIDSAAPPVPPTPLLLSTDDAVEQMTFEARYGSRLRTTGASRVRGTVEGDVDAALDFFALTRCSKILGSYYSSFSELAAAYGDISLEVVQSLHIGVP